jgi:fumarate hydratase subunit alpha
MMKRMRHISPEIIIQAVRDLCIDANCVLRSDTWKALELAEKKEVSPHGRMAIKLLLDNAEISKKEKIPFCQDTGYAVLFVQIGQDVKIDGSLTDILNEGVRVGYREGYLRKSILQDPLHRINTQDNTPATIHYDIVPGDRLKISLLVKGCGCDNKSSIKMITPAEGVEAAKAFILETIENAGPNASPPFVIGIGMGGPFAQAALMAQKALLWPIGKPNPDPDYQKLEEELFEKINNLGIGPAGLGGRTTALGLHIEFGSTHIASFPVAVNIDCHSHRGKEIDV